MELGSLRTEVKEVGTTLLDAPSVVARMEGTGRLFPHTAKTLQIVGVAARALRPGPLTRGGTSLPGPTRNHPRRKYCSTPGM